jgi:crotonobetainyl-CoA:carnitine CoA-transferase CaiB-like acyl-CoA transferase
MGALDGVRVIHFRAVHRWLAAMLFADQGADVVRDDPPAGRASRPRANATWNRGKRSIVLDLGKDADLHQRIVLSCMTRTDLSEMSEEEIGVSDLAAFHDHLEPVDPFLF